MKSHTVFVLSILVCAVPLCQCDRTVVEERLREWLTSNGARGVDMLEVQEFPLCHSLGRCEQLRGVATLRNLTVGEHIASVPKSLLM